METLLHHPDIGDAVDTKFAEILLEATPTDAEVEVLMHVAGTAGWHVKVVSGELDMTAFRQFYEDPEADVLWVIVHDEQMTQAGQLS